MESEHRPKSKTFNEKHPNSALNEDLKIYENTNTHVPVSQTRFLQLKNSFAFYKPQIIIQYFQVAQRDILVQTVPYLVHLRTTEKNVSLRVLAKEVKPVTHLLVVSYRQQQ